MNSALRHPIFNNEYELLFLMGEGSFSKVVLARNIKDPELFVAIKYFKKEYLENHQNSK